MNEILEKDFNLAKGKNAKGYADPTATKAINNVMNEREIHRGEIYFIGEPGYEKSRPAIIVSHNERNKKSSSVSVVYLSAKSTDGNAVHVDVMSRFPSTALCETVSRAYKENVKEYIRTCSKDEMERIDKGLAIVLGLDINSGTERNRGAGQKETVERDRKKPWSGTETISGKQRNTLQLFPKEIFIKSCMTNFLQKCFPVSFKR